ncbi:MAG: hypothetical protein AAF901_08895, partial [Bacteroidota bacterium]
ILELMPPSRIGENYSADPTIHSVDLANYAVLIDMCLRSNYRFDIKSYYFLRYTQTILYKYLGFGLKKHVSVLMDNAESKVEEPFYNLNSEHGFLSFEKELELHENLELRRRRSSFKKDSVKIIDESINNSLSDSRENIESQNDGFVDYLNGKVKYYDELGIKLVFVISPRKRAWDQKYLVSIKSNLNSEVIDLSSAKDYPFFFNYEYSFDETHLNEKGAEIFTIELAKQLNRRYNWLKPEVTSK